MNALEARARALESRLETVMNGDFGLRRHVADAARYSLSAGGKRLRPSLLLEFFDICGGVGDVRNFACGVEMIQTYSLIHDDLPALDNDDMRRGKPSCHRAFGEGIAIIAGDALLNGAFEMMLSQKDIPSERLLRAVSFFADRSGVNGMIGGQSIDITCENYDEQSYIEMISLKTAALFEASCAAGAILAGAGEDLIERARAFGLNCGLAFQIKDDLMDDELAPNSALTVFGREKSERLIGEYVERAVNALSAFKDCSRLSELARWLSVRNI